MLMTPMGTGSWKHQMGAVIYTPSVGTISTKGLSVFYLGVSGPLRCNPEVPDSFLILREICRKIFFLAEKERRGGAPSLSEDERMHRNVLPLPITLGM